MFLWQRATKCISQILQISGKVSEGRESSSSFRSTHFTVGRSRPNVQLEGMPFSALFVPEAHADLFSSHSQRFG